MSDNEVKGGDEETTILPTLYHESKKRKWQVWVTGDIIYRNDGLSSKEFVKKPTSRQVTAKRGTTSSQQALIEAKRFWIKKIDQGFTPAEDDEEGQEMYSLAQDIKSKQGGNNHGTSSTKGEGSVKIAKGKASTLSVGSIKHLPMLAHKYQEKIKRVIWDKQQKKTLTAKIGKERFHNEYFDASSGAFITTKLDGVHCLAYVNEDDKVVLLSRNGKQFVFLDHVRAAVKAFLLKSPNNVLTGELYVHSPTVDGVTLVGNERFRYISSVCKTTRSNPHKDEKQIQLHVFDLFDGQQPNLRQIDRLKILKSLFEKSTSSSKSVIVPVQIHRIESADEITTYQGKFARDDYEGVILRDPYGVYKGGDRSIHLLKYKEFYDEEFPIVGADPAKGASEGAVVWRCETNDGENSFSCSMMGDLAARREMYDNYVEYLGKPLTVRHQGLGNNGVPRFPRGVAIRDYE